MKKNPGSKNLERGGLDGQAVCNLDGDLDLSSLWTHHPFFFLILFVRPTSVPSGAITNKSK
jgi:hypothetical protein